MKIIVCVKQVPDTRGKVSLKKDGSLDRAKMSTIINPDDLGAVESALKLKEKTGAKVVAITMGPPMASVMMHELYAMGVDETVLMTGREVGGSDTYGTSTVLATMIRNIGLEQEDVIFCGRQAIDGDTAQVGPELAEKLGIAQLTYVSEVNMEGSTLTCKRLLEDGYMTVQIQTPCLLSCMKEIEKPRCMRISRVFDWDEKRDMRVINYAELKEMDGFDETVIGTKLSPTIVLTSFALPKKTGGMLLEGAPADQAKQLFRVMEDKHVLG
jgi:electron transfer flavoprotein beta subunit